MRDIPFFLNRIKKNQKTFLKFEQSIEKEKKLIGKCELAYVAANFAIRHSTDVFSSEIIENVFLELAQKNSIKLSQNYNKNSVLHVMTEAYTSGGHTRCVERWVVQMPHLIHSCVILNQNADFPENLKSVVEKSGGQLERYDVSQTMLKKALKLREHASSFEYIVLHIHMDDPIALIAFGTNDFKRPILYFNHADHIFWLGVSIADHVADLNSNGHLITLRKRGGQTASILGIPVDDEPHFIPFEKKYAREKLGILDSKKIIFSSGSEKKYYPLDSLSFFDIVSDVLSKDKNIIFYIMGVNLSNVFWMKLKKKFPNNLFVLKPSGYEADYKLYLSAADLVIDSYPVGGGTAIIDAVKANKPVLSLSYFQSDFLLESKAYCASYKDFLDKVHLILEDEEFAQSIKQDVHDRFKLVHGENIWRKKCEDIFAQLSTHRIRQFKREISNEVSYASLSTSCWVEPVRNAFSRLKKRLFQVRFSKGRKIIRLFGFYFLNKNNIV